MDEESIKQTLVQWASEKALSEVSLSADGQSLSWKGTTLPNQTLTVEFGDKSCQYSLTSIYLQILDPKQGLLAYRNACKKYSVDPVKASDKPTVVGFFLGASDEVAPKEAAPAEAVVPQDKTARPSKSKDRKRSSSKHEHRAHKDSSKRRESDKKRDDSRSSKKKKHKSMVTNKQLFDNLNVVVDKRHIQQETAEEITKALSTEGFAVTDDVLKEYKESAEAILANEIPVGNSASILRAANPRKDLSRVLEIFLETANPTKSSGSVSQSKSSRSSGANKPRTPSKSYLIGKKPVIVVPKGMTAPITLINAHEFLCNHKYVPRDVMIKQGRQRTPPTTFTRNVRVPGGSGGTSLVEYEIVDNPKKLGGEKEWERIVAVIVLGQAWQFKDWPAKYNDPVHLFARTFGFQIVLEGDKIPPESQGWAVVRGKLNRDKRGLDSVTSAQFWNGLDQFMNIHKRELLPQAES